MYKANSIVVRMNNIMNAKQYNYRNRRASHLLDVAVVYVPGIFNSAVALCIFYILTRYIIEIGYVFAPEDIASLLLSRNTLANSIDESVVAIVDDL